MKKLFLSNKVRSILAVVLLCDLHISAFAQEKVSVNGHDVGTWFRNNWMWVTGAVVLLLLILLAGSGGSRRRKTTTVVKDNYGDVKRVTTTEETE